MYISIYLSVYLSICLSIFVVGTLMRIVSARRNEDSTLALVVQVPSLLLFFVTLEPRID